MENMVEKNEYGFFALSKKPSPLELKQYYAEKYYQDAKGSYEEEYSNEEVLYFNNKIEQKYEVAKKIIGAENQKTLIDIGCGEGWTLNFFKEKGWLVKGLDYSDYGCRRFNPSCLDALSTGDLYENLDVLIKSNAKFSIVWLDNVLEHVLDPLHLMNITKKLVEKDGVIIVEVPNDFSVLQQHLLSNGTVAKPYWIAIPDHISYFNKEGLLNLAKAAGLDSAFVMADFPVDMNLLNPLTNYYSDKNKGKVCHHAKIKFENFLHTLSIDKTNALYRAMSDLGIGRQIIAFFVPQEKN